MHRGSRPAQGDSQYGASNRRDSDPRYGQHRGSEPREYDDSRSDSREFPDRHQQGQPRASQRDGRFPHYADDFGLQTGPDAHRMGEGKRGVTSDWERDDPYASNGPEHQNYRGQSSRPYGEGQYGGSQSRGGSMWRSDDSGREDRSPYGQSTDELRSGSRQPYGGGQQHRAYEYDPGHKGMPQHFSAQQSYSYPGVSSAAGQGTSQGRYTGKGPKGYKRSDEQICEEANQRLERNGDVDASEVEVSCNAGTLILRGKVEDRRAKREAENCVEDIYGVHDVMNELKVDRGFFAKLFNTDGKDDTGSAKGQQKKS